MTTIAAKNYEAVRAAAAAALSLQPGMYEICRNGVVNVYAGMSSVPAERYAVTYDRKTRAYTFKRI